MSDRPSVCLSVRMEQVGFRWTNFYKIWDLDIFGKYIEVDI